MIAIIGILIGLLLAGGAVRPGVGAEHAVQVEPATDWPGARSVCRSAREVEVNFPIAAQFPTVGANATPVEPPLSKVLASYTEDNQEMYHCPSDQLDEKDANPIGGVLYETYFEQEGLSYEYRSSKLVGKTREQVRLGRRIDQQSGEVKYNELSSMRVFIVNDFQPFHGPKGDNGSRNCLYLDGHVDALLVADD